jgi:hypothetical protein
MSAEDSALATLGLRRGAGRAEVDSAYRRLMKIHHPDRTGGDGGRASEINRAYTCLRQARPPAYRSSRPSPVPVRLNRPPRPARAGWGLALIAVSLVGFGLYQESQTGTGASRTVLPAQWAAADAASFASLGSELVRFDAPLHSRVIGAAIAQAVSLHSSGDLAFAAEYSRDCHNRLRENPNLAMFDACAAFDESALTLTMTDPRSQSGPFGGSAVMSRQMGSARALSDDMFGADSRLRQIRSRVDLALLPRIHELPAPKPSASQRH